MLRLHCFSYFFRLLTTVIFLVKIFFFTKILNQDNRIEKKMLLSEKNVFIY